MNGLTTTQNAGDPFIEQFFARLPEEMHTDFTDRQLAALKSVFGDATRSGHAFDIRLNMPTPLVGRGLYMVFLGGRNHRKCAPARPQQGLARSGLAAVGKFIVGALFFVQLIVTAVVLLYWLL